MTTTRSAPAVPRIAPPMAADGFGPAPPTRAARNVAGALLGALLIVFCAAAVAVYTARVGHRRAVLVVARPVSAGAVIQAADVGEVGVSADRALRTIPATQRNLVVGRVAGVNLVVGTLLTVGQLATGPQSDANHAIVGLAVKAGQYPAALRAADRVLVVDTGRAGSVAQSGAGPPDAIVLVVVLVARVHAFANSQVVRSLQELGNNFHELEGAHRYMCMLTSQQSGTSLVEPIAAMERWRKCLDENVEALLRQARTDLGTEAA